VTSEGMLKPGDIFKTPTGDLWYVDTVSPSGAYCIGLSVHPTPITTRKKATKIVNRHLPNTVFSRSSVVDLVDQNKLDGLQLKRRIDMARKDGAVAENETAEPKTTEPKAPAVPRVASKYVLTDKAREKELRGQAKEVNDAFVAAAGEAKSAEEIGAACVFAGSRQDKTRVAGYYIAQFKKEGFLKAVEAPAAESK
jgi:hypothetical protein